MTALHDTDDLTRPRWGETVTDEVKEMPVIEAKTRAEDAIRGSDLRYTMVRPAVLVGRWARGDLHVAPPGTGVWGVTPRRDLARLLAGPLVTEAPADRTFEVGRNPLLGDAGLDIEWTLPE